MVKPDVACFSEADNIVVVGWLKGATAKIEEATEIGLTFCVDVRIWFGFAQVVDEAGKRSTRSLTGLRSSSNILLVGSYDAAINGKFTSP